MSEVASPAFHGYAPPGARASTVFCPPLCVAISRETGARGRSVAHRTAELLGCHFIDQESLEYATQNSSSMAGLEVPVSSAAREWIDGRIQDLTEGGLLTGNEEIVPLVRLILEVVATGPCVILGRGAGCVLPGEAKLHVRLIAPESDRIAYIAQLERLSLPEAQEVVRQRDESRRKFTKRFGRSPTDIHQYDMLLNTARLGVELCSSLIVAACGAKQSPREPYP